MTATIENPKIADQSYKRSNASDSRFTGNSDGHTITLEPYLSAIIPANGAEINVGMTLAIKINPI